MKMLLSGLLAMGLAAGPAMAAPKAKSKAMKSDVLAAGSYSAKVKAIVCAGCPSLIEGAMRKFKGIESASVDPKAGTVNFMVKKGEAVKLADLQKTLQAAAGEMGMGANFELYEVKPLKKA